MPTPDCATSCCHGPWETCYLLSRPQPPMLGTVYLITANTRSLRHSSARTAGCAETAPMRRIAHPPWPRSAAKEPWKRPLGGSHSWVTSRGASRPSTRPLGGSLHLLGRAWLPKQDADTTPGCAPPQDADTAPGRAPTQDTDTAHREDPHEGSLAVHRQALLLHFVPPANYIGLPPHLVSWCSLANS